MAFLSLFLLSSCFTGVESTKKITLSRDDLKALKMSEEEEFFKTIAPIPLAEWKPGKKFIAADNRTALIFESEGLPVNPVSMNIGGDTLYFSGIVSRIAPDGNDYALIEFADGHNKLLYNTGKKSGPEAGQVMSDAIPMIIDLDMVASANNLLSGKKLWTKSPLWYDSLGNRIPGKKYVPVTITGVSPGSLVFPVKIAFTDENNAKAWMYMNFGRSGKESRSFANLFYLSDLRRKYPGIDDDVWQLICNGKVKSGMSKMECKLALGNPSEVESGRDYSQTLDLWNYPNGAVLWFEDGILTRFRM